jgi:hypothetical protein
MSRFCKKLAISVGSSALFTAINLPISYRLTNLVSPLNLVDTENGCPTFVGRLVHTLLFFIFTFLSMGNPFIGTTIKLKHSIYGTLIAFFLSSKTIFANVNSILGDKFADQYGCPTLLGVFTHAFIYCLALMGVMYLPNDKTIKL